ncbi:cysteine--tRNA ligase [Natronorarus salvus]|uniref:cysteine--tRNA ligase n=1 Tax=Natronorarus salvus TaxID=3117733 RepID=UPI002F26C0A1
MSLRVYNTLTGETEPFEPRDPDSVLLYYCGLTVSDLPHLGHARAWVHVDVVHRWLSWLGYDVRHVENFTDVNEKIVARVGELGESEATVAREMIGRTLSAMRSLNLLRAEVYPRVSEHVPEILDLIEWLIERGYAYEANGSVYFDVTAFEGYGKLSNQEIEEVESQGEETGEKRHPADFALWKADGVSREALAEHVAELPEEPPKGRTWGSPWGEGRPGWHIECSAMSMTHLGESIDVHIGGQDLVFPHHENEIAQSEAATGEEFARYWLHVRLLETEGEKMSSSLGNFFTVEDAVERFGVNVLRMFLLSTSYSSRQTYNEAALSEAEERWERLSRAYERAVDAADGPDARTKVEDRELRETIESAREAFVAGMNDDFNTREALASLLSVASAVNRHLDAGGPFDYRGLTRAIETVEELGGSVLGFVFGAESEGTVELAEELVGLIVSLREEEREAGAFDRADELREELERLGVTVEDGSEGPTYRLPE